MCSRIPSSVCGSGRLSYGPGVCRVRDAEVEHTIQLFRPLSLGSTNSQIAEGEGVKKLGDFWDCHLACLKTAEELDTTPSSGRKQHPEETHQDLKRS